MPTPTNSLAAAYLTIFILILPPALYNLMRHGSHGYLGWGYLFAFAILRITGSGLQLSGSDLQTAEVINGVGLSPLVLAVLGVLHECSHWLRQSCTVNRSLNAAGGPGQGKESKPFVLGQIPYIISHLLAGLAIALVVVGATHKPSPELGKEKVGYFVFLIVWIVIAVFVVLAWSAKRRSGGERNANLLLYSLTFCVPFLFIRIVYAIAAAFNSNINPETGPIGYRIVLQALMEFLVSIALVIAGVLSSNICRNTKIAPNAAGSMGAVPLESRGGFPGSSKPDIV